MTEKKKKLLVAIDGSENSDRALMKAKEYGEAFDMEITILTVLKQSLGYQTTNKNARKVNENETREEIGEAILKESLEIFKDFEGEVYTTLRNGDPGDEILEEAEFGEFDLIIMGNRGLGVFSRTFLGSVSNKVINHTKSNVLIIK